MFIYIYIYVYIHVGIHLHTYICTSICVGSLSCTYYLLFIMHCIYAIHHIIRADKDVFTVFLFIKSLRLRPPTPEAYGKTADFGTLCIPGSSQRLDPSAALLSSDRSRLAALHVMLTPCPVPWLGCIFRGFQGGVQRSPGVQTLCNRP